MTTLLLDSSLWRRTRTTILAATVALSTVLAPAGIAVALDTSGTEEQGFTVPDTGELSGLTAQISTGGSDTLELRAEPSATSDVVATLDDGEIVDLRIDVLDTVYDSSGTRWWPVSADGDEGWVSGFNLIEPGAMTTKSDGTTASRDTDASASSFSWDGGSLEGATARVTSEGDGLSMRAEPDRNGDVVAKIPDGTIVDLRIDMTDTVYDDDGVTRWWPVMYDGEPGWVAGSYLTDASDTTGEQFTWDGGSLEGATAIVNADGNGLRLRAEPSETSDSVASIPDGTVVDLRIDVLDTVYDDDGVTRWWPVEYDGNRGWVSGFYLTDGSDRDTGTRVPFEWDGGALEGATAITEGDGASVDVRAEPSAGSDLITTLPDGTTVDLRIDMVDTVIGPDGLTRWWPVEVDGLDGWISGYFLTDGATPSSEREPSRTDSDIFPAGSTALVQTQSGGGAKLRDAAGLNGTQIGSVPERSEVTILDGPVSRESSENGWFEVDADGTTGFIDGDLLVLLSTPTAPTLSDQDGQDARQPQTDAGEEEPAAAPATRTPAPAPSPTPTATSTPDTDAPQADERRASVPTATSTPTPELTPTPTEEPAEPDDQSSAEGFIYPVPGATLTQNFGCSSLGFYPYNPEWGCGVHDGMDFAAPSYTPIVAVASGTVVTAGWCDCGLGYYVEIDHGNNLHTLYGHMASQPYVSVGQQVSQGEEIGPVGSTGLSTGPHTHFMVQINGVSQDPSRYLP